MRSRVAWCVACVLMAVASVAAGAAVFKTPQDAFKAAGLSKNMLKPPTGDVTGNHRRRQLAPVQQRGIHTAADCVESRDGRDAELCRVIGSEAVHRLDPFLMLDHFHVQAPGGFPSHPHRGFETVTYMLDGAFQHEDTLGSSGVIHSGDVQWMTAGSGIIHSEQPVGDGVNTGMQLWVNLPAALKTLPPAYQTLRASDMAEVSLDTGVVATVVCGTLSLLEDGGVVVNATGPATSHTPIVLADVYLPDHTAVTFAVPRAMTGFVYVMAGAAAFGPELQPASKGRVMVLEQPETVPEHVAAVTDFLPHDTFTVNATESSVRVYVGMGEPIREPVVAHGPFVMNTAAEVRQAFRDYQSGKLVVDTPAGHRHTEL